MLSLRRNLLASAPASCVRIASGSEALVLAFFSVRFSKLRLAATYFSRSFSSRGWITSSLEASRLESPRRCPLSASMKSFSHL